MPSTDSLAQNTRAAVSMLSNQQGSKANAASLTKGPFAELLKNLFIDAPDAKLNGNDQGNFSSRASGKNGLTGSLLAFPEGIHSGDSSGESSGDMTADKEPSKHELENVIDCSGLASLILGTVQAKSNVQAGSKSGDAGIGGSPESLAAGSQPLLTGIEQQLIAFLTTSQNSKNGDSSASSQPSSPVAGSPSQASNLGNGFMSMLSKKVAENAATKTDLLKLLSEASNSSINRNSSNDVEEILSELSKSGSQLDNGNPGANFLRKSAGNVAEAFKVSQPQGKIQADKVFQSETKEAEVPQPAKDGQLAQSFSDKIQEAQILPSRSIAKDSSAATSLQSAANTSKETDKNSAKLNDQNVIETENATGNSDKTGQKTFPVAGKQESTSNGFLRQKSDNALGSLIKQDGSGIYQSVSMDSKVDPRFRQEFSNAVENSHDNELSKPDVTQVTQTIIREAKMMTQENKTVVNVKLEPESLGSVVLRVSSDNGKISAEFTVRTTDAHAYLESSVPQMKQMLESNGVSLSHLTVNLSGGESQTKRQQYSARRNSQRFSMDTVSDSTDAIRDFGYNTMEVKV